MRHLQAPASWCIVVVIAVAAGGGCGRQQAGTDQLGEPGGGAWREGYAYLAPLATHHPLYVDLVRLDQAIQRLRLPETALQPAALPPGDWLERTLAGEAGALEWPAEAWLARRQRVSGALVGPPPQPPDKLPADLAATVRFRKRQAAQAATAQLLEAETRASRELASASAELYRSNQERLNDLGERLGGTGETREAVIAELEAELTRLSQQHEQRLAQLKAELAAQSQAQAEEAERAAWRQAEERLQPPMRVAARSLGAAIVERMGSLTPPEWPAKLPVALPAMALPLPEMAPPGTDEGIERGRREARARQAQLLVTRRAEITHRILAATRLAAEKVARDRRLRLYLLPGDDAVGPDVTTEITGAVQGFWAAQDTSQ